ncbi:MAG: fibronectin type III domain-containing protein [Desulfobulbaceae bacterium]|nr:fibronectin type III domain-containing protein [Desulfobulbaceae bacterium]
MKRPVATITLSALLLIFFLTPAGCGRKTPPVPPTTILPTEITDLHHQLDEKGVTLTWTAPTKTVKGDKLDQIDGFELLRAVVSDDDYCEGCPINFGHPIKINKTMPGHKVHYQETVLRPGYHYIYQVRTKLGWHHASKGSNIITFAWNTLLSPVKNLTAVAGDHKINLSWQAPASLIDGTRIDIPVTYQIYRSVAGAEFTPLGPALPETTYTDVSVQNNTRYTYKIQPLSKKSVGMMSKPAQAMPVADVH